MLGHLAIAIFFVLIGLTFLISNWKGAEVAPPRIAAVFPLAIAAIVFCIGLLRRNVTEMAVTNKRVIVKTGLAERRTTEILLSRIESLVVDEPAMGRVLGYGTVIVRGTGGTPEVFEKIQHPLKFREQVQNQIAGERKAT